MCVQCVCVSLCVSVSVCVCMCVGIADEAEGSGTAAHWYEGCSAEPKISPRRLGPDGIKRDLV